MKNQSGLTLIELIIVVTIIGIMAAAVAPNFGGIMSRSKLKTSYNTFVGTIATARTEAANRNMTISLCISNAAGTRCEKDRKWSDGYLVFTDFNSNGWYNPGLNDRLLKVEPAVPGITISSAEYVRTISLRARGRLRTEGTFVFCNGDVKNARALNLWVTGLGRLATDSNADGIVEGVDRTNVSCE